MLQILKRPRRNRKSLAIRTLVAETTLLPGDLVAPFFLLPGTKREEPISTLPGISRLSIDLILKQAEHLHSKGIAAIALFPVISKELKDPQGNEALRQGGLIPEALKRLKEELPSLCVITDIALDPYTSHGHDGVLNAKGVVDNDATVDILSELALLHASHGADFVAPSDMMDGRVSAIRKILDKHALQDVGILAYSAKYASALYSPFREALGSELMSGDKKSYQLNPANVREALLEARLDEEEGADILMVKPALFYLDVIARLRMQTHVPICAYHVSGEYAMVMAAEQLGFLDSQKVFYEALLSIKRAGADFIISYATPFVVDRL